MNEWISAVVNVLSVGFGWGLGIVGERISRRRQQRDARAARRDDAVRRASVLIDRLATSPPQLWEEQLREVHARMSEVTLDLREFDETGAVAGWWVRQVTAAMGAPPFASRDKRRPGRLREQTVRSMGVNARMRAWAEGQADAEEFAQKNDAGWDAALRDHFDRERRKASGGNETAGGVSNS